MRLARHDRNRPQAGRRFASLAAVGVMAALATGCGSGSGGGSSAESASDGSASDASVELIELLRANELTSVATAIETLDLEELVDGASFTFFAPNDEAFQTLDAEEIAELLNDPINLAGVLRNHLLSTRLTAADLASMDGTAGALENVSGTDLTVMVDGETMSIGDATIVQSDLAVGDGVVHVIDRILLP